ncbi:MAG: hypothetical protein K2F81_04900 [Ruminococcus sp.]|nr:hypothetical protein [Ruminococcus sp.]
MDAKNNFIPDDDYEYEKQLAEQERLKREREEAEKAAQIEHQKQLDKQRDKRIQAEKIELIKLKNGVIDQSESIKEEHDQIRELHGFEKVSNFWFHHKIIILFTAFIVLVCAFIFYNTLSKDQPDLTVMMIANNGLSYRQEELEDFFEKYTEDLNGDGKVYVSVLIAPLDNTSHDELMMSNQSKFFANLQTADCMLFITDSNTDEDIKNLMKSDLNKDFIDNDYITTQGLSLNMKLFAQQIKFENMPNDVTLSIRQPVKTINSSLEEMEESYAKSFKIFSAITNDLTSQAKESNDPGLTTEPIKKENSSSSDDTASSKSE